VEKFGGGQLVQQEPDASSFQMEVLENTLKLEVIQLGILHHLHLFWELHFCIPTVFISHTGEASVL